MKFKLFKDSSFIDIGVEEVKLDVLFCSGVKGVDVLK